jgi:ribonuclease Y
MHIDVVYIIISLVVGAAAFYLGFMLRSMSDRTYKERIVKDAQEEANRIVRDAQKEAELHKKTAILEAKDEWFRAKTEFEKEAAKTRENMRQEQ